MDAIFDGQSHAITATWTQTSGWANLLGRHCYWFGTGLAAAKRLQPAAAWHWGVDLDQCADTWQLTAASAFKGTLMDVRIFSDVRTGS